ncbi:S-methyl-5'-thioadenosine phosphorylase [Halobacteriales archaeon SW_7_68_16]|nr:MAG: S-methyl-5'-thioadenosine phosphorylase [Halobacteriales archaeon SW_7_68_16]
MIGFIGGSGIYDALDVDDEREREVETPYGEPSAPITVGEFAGREVAFLPRHGRDHQYDPTHVPYRANVHALKQLGVERILSSNAVGSLREDLPPRSLLLPDQTVDRTRDRPRSFFGDGMVVHASIPEPYCPHVRDHLAAAADDVDDPVERGGTYVCIEGPTFSTRAESEFYRSNGWDVVGMTAVPEAALAREAELCYATVAGVTDYDVWNADSEVTLGEVLDNAAANERAITAIIERAIETMPDERECDCDATLEGAINTPADAIPDDVRDRVDLLAGQYLTE